MKYKCVPLATNCENRNEKAGKTFYKIDLKRLGYFMLVSNSRDIVFCLLSVIDY